MGRERSSAHHHIIGWIPLSEAAIFLRETNWDIICNSGAIWKLGTLALSNDSLLQDMCVCKLNAHLECNPQWLHIIVFQTHLLGINH